MDPTSFQFLLTMPGDTRLMPAIRELSTQAGNYARLGGGETTEFAQRVVDAAESVIAATGIGDAPIEVSFLRTADVLRVTLTWRANGSEERREVEQRTSA